MKRVGCAGIRSGSLVGGPHRLAAPVKLAQLCSAWPRAAQLDLCAAGAAVLYVSNICDWGSGGKLLRLFNGRPSFR